MSNILAVPTNIITGFLGVGKTTAIRSLLQHKPDHERWAVLVNEFGEVGIDGALYREQDDEQQGVFIREVPGGCMCCTAGLPMQVALNALLQQSKPHRLLIEPTGLGHPVEVVDTLSAPHYANVLDLRATLTLVDARKVLDPRYATHPTFVQQLQIADQVIANKVDLYGPEELEQLQDFLQRELAAAKPLRTVEHGQIPLSWLEPPSEFAGSRRQSHGHAHGSTTAPEPISAAGSAQGYRQIDNSGEGFFSRGWVFEPSWVFAAAKLEALFSAVELERLKAVFITDQGVLAFNKVEQALEISARDDCLDSRLECISNSLSPLEQIEAGLWDCVVSRGQTTAKS